ncbi:MAG: hypothetical protein ACLT98_02070 [Eggerthellaceae bacterium]
MRICRIVGIETMDALAERAPEADAIDFSHKGVCRMVEAYVHRTNAALVSGTTGYDEDEMARSCAR